MSNLNILFVLFWFCYITIRHPWFGVFLVWWVVVFLVLFVLFCFLLQEYQSHQKHYNGRKSLPVIISFFLLNSLKDPKQIKEATNKPEEAKKVFELHMRCWLIADFTVFFRIQTKSAFPMALNLGIVTGQFQAFCWIELFPWDLTYIWRMENKTQRLLTEDKPNKLVCNFERLIGNSQK